MLLEEIKNIKESEKDLKKFGYTVGTILVFIALLLFYFEKESSLYFGGTGLLLIIAALLAPEYLKLVNKIWMILGLLLGWVTSRVILIFLFYLIITPIKFILKISGKDILDEKIEKEKLSYWIKREKTRKDKIDYERQF